MIEVQILTALAPLVMVNDVARTFLSVVSRPVDDPTRS